MPKQKKRLESFFSYLGLIGKIIGSLISAFVIFIFIMLLISLFSSGVDVLPGGNIAVIPVSGTISIGSDGSRLFGESVADTGTIIRRIHEANASSRIKAIILEINSPGGSPVATDEVVSALKQVKKPKVAVIRETGASGAYWIATAADRIFANKMSVTGSIGVIGSHLEYAGIMQNYNVTYRRLVAGKYKDIGTPYKEMTPDETALYQNILDTIHDFFIEDVASNRKLPVEVVRNLSTGFVYLGSEAQKLGLIDEIGSKDDAARYLAAQLNITPELAEYKESAGLFSMLSSRWDSAAYRIGQGIGNSLVQTSTDTIRPIA
jgi:protease-4